MLKISIIIPIFNHSEYVQDCLKSILYQKDECFEIVAIDDGSVDDSYEKSLNYLSENFPADIWKLTTRENKGINATLNEAISQSSGEIIYLLASDDRMPLFSLKKIREYYLMAADKKKLFFYDVSLINWKGEIVKESAASIRRGGAQMLSFSKLYLASQIILRWGHPFAHQFYSRSYFDKYGPYPENLKYEDLFFALKAVALNKFDFVPLVLKEYRLRQDLSHTPGLNLAELNSTQSYIRKKFFPTKEGHYKFLFLIGREGFRTKSKAISYFGALIQLAIYYFCFLVFWFKSKINLYRNLLGY